MNKYFDFWTMMIILITLILFIAALFAKGLTHNLLLEVGIFLVSVKLILMGYKNHLNTVKINEKLDKIQKLINKDQEHRK